MNTAGNPRGVSMREVAELAGVSAQTVSRVSTGSDAVLDGTRDKVLKAMKELGYRPNSAARALKYGRFKSVGVLVFSLSHFGSVKILDAITQEIASRGYSVDLFPLAASSTGEISQALSRLDQDSVDGIIVVLEAHELAEWAIDFPTRVPSVLIDSRSYDDRISINADQRRGAQLAVQHLLDLGHETVWHLAGPVEESNAAADRQAGWREILLREGRSVPEPLGFSWDAEQGYLAGRRLAANTSVTAVFAANDQLALGVIRAIHESGRRVPEDVSVVGFDNLDESAYYWPPLTTIDQHFAMVGEQAVDLLFESMDAQDVESGVRLITPELVVRGSTAQRGAVSAGAAR